MSLPSYWKINSSNTVHLYKTDPIYEHPVLNIFVDDTFNFIIPVFAWCLPTNHEIYKNYNSSVKNITVSNLVKVLSNYRVYEGFKNQQVLSYCNQHAVLKKLSLLSITTNLQKINFIDLHYTFFYLKTKPVLNASILNQIK